MPLNVSLHVAFISFHLPYFFSIVHSFFFHFPLLCGIKHAGLRNAMRYVQTGQVVSTQTPAFFHMSLSPCSRFSIVLKACAGCHLEGSWTYACISSVLFFPTCQVRGPRDFKWFYQRCVLSSSSSFSLSSSSSAASRRQQWGPQARAPDLSGHCRTSTASAGSHWALPDINRERRISVGTAGPQPRAPDLSGHCRTSTASAGSQCQRECQNRCQRQCQNRCQKGCQIGCQNRCQIECQRKSQNVRQIKCQIECQIECQSICQNI